MSRLATAFVRGYHGCEHALGLAVIAGEASFDSSENDYDWLGPGRYFWESDPQRALEFARDKPGKKKIADPFVIGAVIDLGNCLDLVARANLEHLREAHDLLVTLRKQTGMPIPQNTGAKTKGDKDKPLRFLDCAVIRQLHETFDSQIAGFPKLEPFDTVRGMFVEGEPLYAGGGFGRRSHVQIAVRDSKSILGYFVPNPYPSST